MSAPSSTPAWDVAAMPGVDVEAPDDTDQLDEQDVEAQ